MVSELNKIASSLDRLALVGLSIQEEKDFTDALEETLRRDKTLSDKVFLKAMEIISCTTNDVPQKFKYFKKLFQSWVKGTR